MIIHIKTTIDTDDKIISMSLGGKHSSAISLKGRVFTWGCNTDGQLGDKSNAVSWEIEMKSQIFASL